MELDQETQEQIQELQILEQNLQSLIMQKQAFDLENNEAEIALKELEKTNQEVYKIVSNIVIKSNKEDLIKELKHKKELITLRLKTIEVQEKTLMENSEKLRDKVLAKIGNHQH